ncbi:MAG: CHAD domain-containing protein [Phototrophicaceae bacterium]
MPFEFKIGESLADGIRRVLQSEIKSAIGSLTPPLKNAETDIHDARKRFKKIRALLVLAQDAIGKKAYRRENRFYRDCGRALAANREQAVALRRLDQILQGNPSFVTPAVQGFRDQLAMPTEAILTTDEELRTWVSALEQAHERSGFFKIEAPNFDVLAPALQQVYHAGQVWQSRALAMPLPENLHEWRKQVKTLWYQLRLIQPIYPQMITPFNLQLEALAEALGDDHDYADLLIRLDPLSDTDEGALALRREIEALQVALRQHAFALAAPLYAERPKPFAARHHAYWGVMTLPPTFALGA